MLTLLLFIVLLVVAVLCGLLLIYTVVAVGGYLFASDKFSSESLYSNEALNILVNSKHGVLNVLLLAYIRSNVVTPLKKYPDEYKVFNNFSLIEKIVFAHAVGSIVKNYDNILLPSKFTKYTRKQKNTAIMLCIAYNIATMPAVLMATLFTYLSRNSHVEIKVNDESKKSSLNDFYN